MFLATMTAWLALELVESPNSEQDVITSIWTRQAWQKFNHSQRACCQRFRCSASVSGVVVSRASAIILSMPFSFSAFCGEAVVSNQQPTIDDKIMGEQIRQKGSRREAYRQAEVILLEQVCAFIGGRVSAKIFYLSLAHLTCIGLAGCMRTLGIPF